MKALPLIISAILSYFTGNINPSYIIARMKKFDIRKVGSGNAGGSNALIAMGKLVGIGCMLFDIFKAYFAVKISLWLIPNNPLVVPVASTSVILGHIFPVFMRFKGGKGLACLGGSMLAYNPGIAMIVLGIEIILVLVINYIVVVPITASMAFPIIYYVRGGNIWGMLIMFLVTVSMFYKHQDNFKRISAGKEFHFSYLWKKDKEMERVRSHMTDEEFENLNIKKEI